MTFKTVAIITDRFTFLVALVVPAVACVGDSSLRYTEPPATSYQLATHQLRFGETSASVSGAAVAPEFFSTSGVQPLIGRLFVEDEYRLSSGAVVVLSYQLWTQRFASSPAVIGREIQIDERRTRVVGVMPAGFTFPEPAQLWIPKLHNGPS